MRRRDHARWLRHLRAAHRKRRKLRGPRQGALRCWVFGFRRAGMSVRRIARHLFHEHGVVVCHETVADLLRRHDPLGARRPKHRCEVCRGVLVPRGQVERNAQLPGPSPRGETQRTITEIPSRE